MALDTELLDKIEAQARQAHALVLGLTFALNAKDGAPARDIVDGMLSTAADLMLGVQLGIQKLGEAKAP